jgi:hypothetical protein
MRSLQLQTALSQFIHDAGSLLQADLDGGAEIPYEVEQQRGRRRGAGPSLYCYQPLTGQFVEERKAAVEALPTYAPALRLLVGYEGLDRYLASVGVDLGTRARQLGARAAMQALLGDVFAGLSDFEPRPERVEAALARLEQSNLARGSETMLVASLHGLAITSPELALAKGLIIAQPDALEGLPAGARAEFEQGAAGGLVVALSIDEDDPRRAIARGRELLGDLLRALRLFGDGRVTLGTLAWARVGEGSWNPLALGAEGNTRGLLVVSAEQEDELRAFCNLISSRAPQHNELAWALRRFEMGCERHDPHEALTDHLLALRTLLEPEGPGSWRLADRLAVLCATPEDRAELAERTMQAIALERAEIAGGAVPDAGSEALCKDLADHLRALLRDVICGHLDADLVTLADRLSVEQKREPELEPALVQLQQGFELEAAPEPTGVLFSGLSAARSREQVLRDMSQSPEILNIFI